MLALFVGAASIVNGKMVVKYGMRSMMKFALIAMILSSGSFFFYLYFTSGHPPFVLFMVSMASIFFFMGILFGNANAMAMEPVGHIAGVASSIIGAGTTFVSMSLGALVGQFYDQTLLPLIGGYFALALSAYVIMSMIERKDIAKEVTV